MTKPLGTPHNRDTQDTQGTFYGHPIVIRVKDLTWQPPAPQQPAAQQDWVSNLLGEDPHEGDYHDSLLVPSAATSLPEPPVEVAPAAKIEAAPEPAPAVAPAPPAKPSYIHNSSETRQQRRASILSSQMKNRLALGGVAVSLLMVSVWALSGSGGSDESPVENVPQDLFVSTGELGDAPAWNATAANADDSETTTIEPLDQEITQIASLPMRHTPDNSTMSNPSRDTQMTNIATPNSMDVETTAAPYGNPAQTGGSLGTSSDTSPAQQVWQFGPSNREPNYEAPAGGEDIPSFDGPQPQYAPSQTRPLPGGTMNMNETRTSQYSPNPAGGDDRHWMQQESSDWQYQNGKFSRADSDSTGTSPNSGMQMPVIHEGYQHQAGYPVVNNQVPENAPAAGGAPQDNSQWGFGPYSGSSMPQEAAPARARLSGVQDLNLESR